jgi:hypothetical protein
MDNNASTMPKNMSDLQIRKMSDERIIDRKSQNTNNIQIIQKVTLE